MRNLKKVIKDYDGGCLIDDLYFLFHEGSGERLAGNVPQAFNDVNALRTDLRHDVDHGKDKNVRAKRKALANAFQKYSGAPSPAGLAPETLHCSTSKFADGDRTRSQTT